MAKQTYDYKQVQVPVEAYERIKEAHTKLKEAGITIRMAEIWDDASYYALKKAVSKVIKKEDNHGNQKSS